ncbi:MAG: oligopeptide/dipeptide ABC transporter ATP-binding protein [Chloroflexota bacterium]
MVGESGCGKSTTGRAIVRLYKPTRGARLPDVGPTWRFPRATRCGDAPAHADGLPDPYASLDPRMNVASIVAEPMDIHGVGSSAERRDRVKELLATVGLDPNYAVRYPHEFSGGQRQRIGVARALALQPDLIVADEPVSALDVSIQAQIINLLERLQGSFGLTYVFIAHDLSVVRHVSDRIAVMYLGRSWSSRTPRSCIGGPSTRTRRCSRPSRSRTLSEVNRRRIILQGDVPSPVNPPSGCHFHTRCWLRERLGNPERCSAETPLPREIAAGHEVACHFAEDADGPGRARQSTGQGVPSVADIAAPGTPVASSGARPSIADLAAEAGARRGRRRGRIGSAVGAGGLDSGACSRSASPSPRSRRASGTSRPTSRATTS